MLKTIMTHHLMVLALSHNNLEEYVDGVRQRISGSIIAQAKTTAPGNYFDINVRFFLGFCDSVGSYTKITTIVSCRQTGNEYTDSIIVPISTIQSSPLNNLIYTLSSHGVIMARLSRSHAAGEEFDAVKLKLQSAISESFPNHNVISYAEHGKYSAPGLELELVKKNILL